MEKLYKNLIPVAIVIAGLFIAVAVIYTNQGGFQFLKKSEVLSSQEVGQKAIDYVNKNLLSQGTTASLVSVSEEEGMYKVRLNVGGKEYDSYATKDGKFFFPEGYKLATTTQATSNDQNNNASKATCETLAKTDKPLLEAFIVSNCPFGLQMQRILYEIEKNIPSLAENIKVEYMGAVQDNKITSMHGDAEAQENLRQICIREEQTNKYWNYVGCYIQAGDTNGCLATANIDQTKLNACVSDISKGIKYAQADFKNQDKYNITSSPTLILNEKQVSEFDFGGRTAEAVKTLLCCGSNTEIDSCSQTLSQDAAATSFSGTYVGSGSSNNAANCGQ